MRSEKINPEYLSYFKVDSKGKQKNLDPLNLEDWENVRSFVKFLKLFYIVTLKIYGLLYVKSMFLSWIDFYAHIYNSIL